MFNGRSLLKEAPFIWLGPLNVSKRQVCGWICCEMMPFFKSTLKFDMERNVAVVGSTWKIHYSASITGDGI